MYTVNFSPKAAKQVRKLENNIKNAVYDYVQKLKTLKTPTDLYNNGGTELAGNLKGLWRFKDKSFKDFRLLAVLENNILTITVLGVEKKSDVYKNKEKIAK